jgi:hypothetical protein
LENDKFWIQQSPNFSNAAGEAIDVIWRQLTQLFHHTNPGLISTVAIARNGHLPITTSASHDSTGNREEQDIQQSRTRKR